MYSKEKQERREVAAMLGAAAIMTISVIGGLIAIAKFIFEII